MPLSVEVSAKPGWTAKKHPATTKLNLMLCRIAALRSEPRVVELFERCTCRIFLISSLCFHRLKG